MEPEQIQSWRRVMSSMGLSMIVSVVSDKEVEEFANSIQRQINGELERLLNHDDLLEKYAQQKDDEWKRLINDGFHNSIRVIKKETS